MRKFLVGVLAGIVVGVTVKAGVGIITNPANNKVEVLSERVNQEGTKVSTLNNESYIFVNEEKGIYEFSPMDESQWGYIAESKEELTEVVNAYHNYYLATSKES